LEERAADFAETKITTNTSAPELSVVQSASIETVAPEPQSRLVIALLLASTGQGAHFVASKMSLVAFQPFMIGGLRYMCSGVLILALNSLINSGTTLTLPRNQIRSVMFFGCMLCGSAGSIPIALKFMDTGVVATVFATIPLWGALIAGILGTRPTPKQATGLILGFVGIVVMKLQFTETLSSIATLTVLSAALTWAMASTWAREVGLPNTLVSFGLQNLVGGGMLIVISQFMGESIQASFTPRDLGAMAFLVLCTTCFFAFYPYLLKNSSTAFANSFAYLGPAVANLLSFFIFGDIPTLSSAFATIAILVSVFLILPRPVKKSVG
jgi:drug/metabolite transporter (DMT)-like permease